MFTSLKSKLIIPAVVIVLALVVFIVIYVMMNMTSLTNKLTEARADGASQAVYVSLPLRFPSRPCSPM